MAVACFGLCEKWLFKQRKWEWKVVQCSGSKWKNLDLIFRVDIIERVLNLLNLNEINFW